MRLRWVSLAAAAALALALAGPAGAADSDTQTVTTSIDSTLTLTLSSTSAAETVTPGSNSFSGGSFTVDSNVSDYTVTVTGSADRPTDTGGATLTNPLQVDVDTTATVLGIITSPVDVTTTEQNLVESDVSGEATYNLTYHLEVDSSDAPGDYSLDATYTVSEGVDSLL